jgi:prepilin-type N-terminal cleavage/methylation domain-containing protein
MRRFFSACAQFGVEGEVARVGDGRKAFTGERGVTLVELLIVISIVLLLVVGLGFSYEGWQSRYRVEAVSKSLYSDIVTCRAGGFSQGLESVVKVNSSSYAVYLRHYVGNSVNPVDVLCPGFPKNIAPFTLQSSVSSVLFDKHGMSAVDSYIRVVGDVNSDEDCVRLFGSLIELGRFDVVSAKCVI